MGITLRDHTAFLQRTQDLYQQQYRRARAAGEFLDYALEDLRVYVAHNLGDRGCQYCLGPITTANFAFNPKNPPERGGSSAFHNHIVTCSGCQTAKGILDFIEYKELMHLLRTWSPEVRANFLARLRASAGVSEGLEFLRNPKLLP
jgi:5-methylcytosine-specific restriction endonuclease McrA